MTQSWKDTVLSPKIWLRALFMILFWIVNYIVRILILLIAVLQFIITLIKGTPHDKISEFGYSLSTFSYQIMLFLTFNTEEKPFPFAEWPQPEDKSSSGTHQ